MLKFLIYRGSDSKGFAVPLVTMAGLVLIVAGLAIIGRASSDQIKVESEAQQTNAEGLAEAGIARGLNQLSKNNQILQETKSGLCSQLEQESKVSLINADGLVVTFRRISQTLGEIDSTGEYKTARSRINVQFPIVQTVAPDPDNFPGLWAETISGSGGIYANLSIVGDCDSTNITSLGNLPLNNPLMVLPSGNKTPALLTDGGTMVSNRPLPALPEFVLPSSYNSVYGCKKNQTVVLPRASDNPSIPYVLADDSCKVRFDGGQFEVYIDRDLELRGNEEFGNSDVVLHVNGDITLRGVARLGGFNTSLFVYGPRQITQVGTADFYGFVFGPNSRFESTGTAKLGGALWVKYAELGNTTQGKVFQNISPAHSWATESSGVVGLPVKEKISPISSYRTLPVED